MPPFANKFAPTPLRAESKARACSRRRPFRRYISLSLMPLSRTSETSPGSLLRPCGQNQK
ncbi:hypothetical protein GIV48_15940, partial [Pseudomonas syringae]|nr:hypothetical protein [Pseudomonas syringae]